MFPAIAQAPSLRRIPAVPGWEHSLQFLADPYRFIARECRRLGSDVVQARLLLQPALCLTGPHAAALFQDGSRIRRDDVGPEAVRAGLFGKTGVQGLDGAEHLHRRRFFEAACGPLPTAALLAEASRQWGQLMPRWRVLPELVLYEAAQEWLARSACAWAGVPLPEQDVVRRTRQLAALFDGAASGLAARLRAGRARAEAQSWLAGLVQTHRSGTAALPRPSPAAAAAALQDGHGQPLPPRVAAAELLRLLRPIVAVSVFVVLAAHALHEHADWRDALRSGRERDLEAFVQEVRRFYPFFPAVAAQACREFVWEGWHFPAGMRVILDLYGTNHDARAWPRPHEFRPERFFGAIPGLFDFVPHGGSRPGDPHRCPGEGLTLALMKLALRQLVSQVRYQVQDQDLRLQMDRLPALPRDRFVIGRLAPA